MYHIGTISDILRQGVGSFGSVVRALDFYPGDRGSSPIRDVGFFQTMHHFLVTNFHIRKTVFRKPNEPSHKNQQCGCKPDPTQTKLCKQGRRLETGNLGFIK